MELDRLNLAIYYVQNVSGPLQYLDINTNYLWCFKIDLLSFFSHKKVSIKSTINPAKYTVNHHNSLKVASNLVTLLSWTTGTTFPFPSSSNISRHNSKSNSSVPSEKLLWKEVIRCNVRVPLYCIGMLLYCFHYTTCFKTNKILRPWITNYNLKTFVR